MWMSSNQKIMTIPDVCHFPGEGNGNPLQYSCLENSLDRGAWWATVHRLRYSQTQLKWLSMHPRHFPTWPIESLHAWFSISLHFLGDVKGWVFWMILQRWQKHRIGSPWNSARRTVQTGIPWWIVEWNLKVHGDFPGGPVVKAPSS